MYVCMIIYVHVYIICIIYTYIIYVYYNVSKPTPEEVLLLRSNGVMASSGESSGDLRYSLIPPIYLRVT